MDKYKSKWDEFIATKPSFSSYTGRVYMDLRETYEDAYMKGRSDVLEEVIELSEKGIKK